MSVTERCLEQARRSKTRSELEAAIWALSAANRKRPDLHLESELRRLRHQTFLTLGRANFQDLPERAAEAIEVDPTVGLPVTQAPVTAAVVQKTIESQGSLLVRGFLNEERVARLRQGVDSALSAREAVLRGSEPSPWYAEFAQAEDANTRHFTRASGGLLAADSPRGLFQLIEVFADAGITQLAAEFLRGPPVLSVEKSVFRCVHPQAQSLGGWHQDGAFLGERTRSLDVWIALNRCGRSAPGLEIVSRRVDRVLPTGMFFSWDLAEEVIARECPGHAKVAPEFEPGDAILFDQLCVHRTSHLPGMTDARLAIECWLFSADDLPAQYTGLVL